MFGPPQKKFLKAATEGDMKTLGRCYIYDIPDDYSIDARGEKGATALHLAAENGQIEAVRYLLSRGANVEARDDDGTAPLLTALTKDKTEVAKALLEAGADANTHSNEYTYPLHWAAYNGDVDSVRLLVAKGADVNALTRKEERTPLYYAINQNRGKVAEFLLASGARTDIPGTDGQTDADYAKTNNSRITTMIQEAAAKPKDAAAPAVATPAPATEDSETWKLMGASRAAHIGVYSDLNRKITEIFNFATRERLIITENLKTGAETIGAAEKFEALSEEAVTKANEAFKQLGGDAVDRAAKKSFNL